MIPVSGYLHRAALVQGPCKGWQFAELIDYSRSHRAAVTSTYPDDLISRYVGRHDIFCEFHTAITLLQGIGATCLRHPTAGFPRSKADRLHAYVCCS